MNRASGGATGVLAAGVLLALCAACSSAKEGQASPGGGGAGAPAVGANAGNAGHGGDSAETDGNGASGSPNGATPNASGGGAGGAGGAGSSDAGGASAGSNSNPACAAETADAHPVPLDLLILLDASGSMLDMTSTQNTKWDAVKGALKAFLEEDASAGVGVGLQYFPVQKPNVPDSCTSNSDCGDSGPCALKYCYNSSNLFPCEVDADCQTTTGASVGPCVPIAYCSKNQDYLCANPGSTCQALDVSQDLGICQKAMSSVCEHPTSCDVAQYAAPVVPISALPDAAAGLIASVDGKQPSGDTPTGPALSGALQQTKAWATAHRDHRVVTVLVTDGLPTECSPTAGDALAELAKAGVTSSPSINTFVIGVFGAEDTTNAPETVNQIAQHGGTDHAFIVDTKGDVAAQVQAALEAIRGSGPDCRFQIPVGPGGAAFDAGKVNVTLGTATQSRVVQYVSEASACNPAAGGWYYELGSGTPNQIIVCPVTCSAVKSGSTPVKIVLGCPTKL